MLDWLIAKLVRPISVLVTRENVMIIQIYPNRRKLSVSYKRQVKTAKFTNNAVKNMLKGGLDFEKNSFEVLGAAANLIAQIINYKH